MPVAVQMPNRREERDPLDTIVKGLSIASSIYGIKEAGAKADLLKKQQEIDNANKTRELDIKEIEASKKGQVDPLVGLIRQQQYEKNVKEANEISGTKAAATTFGRRMEMADKTMADLASKGYDRTSQIGSAKDAITPSAWLSAERKQQDQAERNFVNSVLRRESGAAISPSEFESAELQYFPRAGDDAETLKQKAANRAQAIAGLKAEAGGAWDKIPNMANQSTSVALKPPGMGSLFNQQAQASQGGSVLRPPGQSMKSQPEIKDIGGVKYQKVQGGWQRLK